MFANSTRHPGSARRNSALTAALAVALTVVPVAPSQAAKVKAKAPTQSTAKYCAAARTWLAFENATLATGPYDYAWYVNSRKVLIPLANAAPKAQKPTVSFFVVKTLFDRYFLVKQDRITQEDEIASLRDSAADYQGPSTAAARDAMGDYTLQTCKIDVLQPFRDLASGFE